jgi:isoleucyl-tRNA synthetase
MAEFPVRKTPDLPEINRSVLAIWEREATFQQTIAARRDAPPWVFYEGPPSANGVPGIHHVMGRALKDLYCRYKTQCGYRVERQAGWDTHGLPVELSVEKALGITKEDIGKSVSIEAYNAECRKAVMRYSEDWRTITERVGYWVDLDRPYVTYESKYIESVWWLLKRIHDQNHLYRGFTVQPYSPMAGSGLSTHELNQPGAYRDVTDLSLVAMFKVRSLPEQAAASEQAHKSNPNAPSVPAPAALKDPAFLEALARGTLHFLAWTTTPWTLPSNTALAVNGGFDYVLVETFNRYSHERVTLILAQGLLEQVFPKPDYEASDALSWEPGQKGPLPYRVLSRLKGADLVGVWYEQLLPWVEPAEDPKQAFRVLSGDFVTIEDGTGIVHIAPTFGADDARVAKAAGVPPLRVLDERGELVPLVDLRGRFVAQVGPLGGAYVKAEYYGDAPRVQVDEEIAVLLKRSGHLFRSQKYVHSYPHCWRTDTPVIYYPMKSWSIRTTAFKEDLIRLNKTIKWIPASTGEGRFGEWLEKLSDWNLSRSRFWGIPLPIWGTEDGTELLCVGSFAELKAEIQKSIAAGVMQADPFAGFTPNDFSAENYARLDVHRPFIDQVVLVSSSGRPMTREPDVIDVWFDSGAMPYASVHYPFENKPAIDEHGAFPADFIAEGVDQTRGWFFTLHAISTMVFGSVAFKQVLSNGLVLDAEGRKMSKRLGNAIDPVKVLDQYGADPIRWYMITNSPPYLNLRFDMQGLEEVVRKFYGTLWSAYSFFATYANADDFTGKEPVVPVQERPMLDRWIVSELMLTIQTVRSNLDAFDATRAYRAVQSFVIDNLSNWYIRLNRRRFWKSEMGQDKLAAYQTVHECLLAVAQLIAPVSPFHAERLFLDLTSRAPGAASVHLSNFPIEDLSLVDEALNAQIQSTRSAASLALSLRKDKGLKVRQPLAKLTIITDDAHVAPLTAMASMLQDEVNVKLVEVVGSDSNIIERSAQLNFREAGPKYGKGVQAVATLVKTLDGAALSILSSGKPVQVTLNGESVELTPELVKITVRAQAGAELASDGNLTVVLDTALTDELRTEGFARELVSTIQKLRKAADLTVTTRILLEAVESPAVAAAFKHHGAYICTETLCDGFTLVPNLDVAPIDVDDVAVQLRVSAK